ncbi:MAG: GTP-binding protein [Fimbriimonadaceae bacterium]
MSAQSNPEHTSYEDALSVIEKAIQEAKAGTKEERAAAVAELKSLESMAEKLRAGRVEIVVFGEINVGKSSLINAILGEAVNEVSIKGGMTRLIKGTEWRGCGYQVQGFDQSTVTITDTPGINEVKGEERARIARAATERADLILFVTDSDLNEIEFEALRSLSGTHKPIILVFNQVDKYSADQRKRLLEVLRDERLPGIIHRDDIVETSADPFEKEYVIQSADGSEHSEKRKPAPNVVQVKTRILEILHRDGKALLALNAAIFAVDKQDKLVAMRISMRQEAAETTIRGYAAAKAVAVAVNPIPAADIIGGSAVDIAMVLHLAKIYGIEMNLKTARDLVSSILKSAGLVLASEWLVHLGAGILKGLTLGLSTLATAVPQGAAAGYASFIVGSSTKYYLEHNASWGPTGAKTVVQELLNRTDKDSVIDRLKQTIQDCLKKNRHAKSTA